MLDCSELVVSALFTCHHISESASPNIELVVDFVGMLVHGRLTVILAVFSRPAVSLGRLNIEVHGVVWKMEHYLPEPAPGYDFWSHCKYL